MRRLNQPELVVIDNPQDIDRIHEHLADKEFVAYDSETTGLQRSANVVGFSICASEDLAFYVILAKWNPETKQLVVIPGMLNASLMLLHTLGKYKLIMHNAIFDCIMAEAFFKIQMIEWLHTDTMILAHLLDENRRIGLKELAAFYFGDSATEEQQLMKESVIANGGIWTEDEKEMYKATPELLGEYGAKDAWLTYMLFMELVPELYEQGLEKFFYEDESMPLLRGPTYEMNNTGLAVDQAKLAQLGKQLEAECLEAKAFILQEIHAHVKDKYPGTKKTNHFNIGSSQQLSWLLFGHLGLEFGTLTKGGKIVAKELVGRVPYHTAAKRDFISTCQQRAGTVRSLGATVNGKKKKDKLWPQPWKFIACDKKTLAKIAPKLKWVARLLEYQTKKKLLSTYVEGIQSRIQYGIIRPSFKQAGTATGRYASSNPNFQNLPRDDKRIKACVVPRPGKVFVGADQSQLEPRIFAFTSGDDRLKKVFRDGLDFYSVIGMDCYDKFDATPYKEGEGAFGVKYKGLRQDSKVFGLASTYGATGHQLAPQLGKSADEAQELINNYFEKFPLVRQMMLDSHEQVQRDGQVFNHFGRPRRLPEAKRIKKLYGSGDLPYEARNILNQAVNFRIQSTGASVINRVAIRLYQNLRLASIDAKIVLQVHDSLIVECEKEDAENVAALMQDAMENTVVLEGIAFEAIPDIGYSLAEV